MASYKLKNFSGSSSRSRGAPFQVLYPKNKARLLGLETIYGLGEPGGILSFLIDGKIRRAGVVSSSGTWCLILDGSLSAGYHTVRIEHHSYIGPQTLILRFIIVHKKGSKASMSGCNNGYYGNYPGGGGSVYPPLIPPMQDPNGCANLQPYCPSCPPGSGSTPPWGQYPGGGNGGNNWPPSDGVPPLPPPSNWPPLIPPQQDDNGCANLQPYCPACPPSVPIYYPPFPEIPGDFLPPSSPPPFAQPQPAPLPQPQPPKDEAQPSEPGHSGVPAQPGYPGQPAYPTPGLNYSFIPVPCAPYNPYPPCPPWAVNAVNDDDDDGEDEYEEEPVVIKKKKKKKNAQPQNITRTIIKKVRKIKNPTDTTPQQPNYPQYPGFPSFPGYPQYPGMCAPCPYPGGSDYPVGIMPFEQANPLVGSAAGAQAWPSASSDAAAAINGINGGYAGYAGNVAMPVPNGMAANFNGFNYGCGN